MEFKEFRIGDLFNIYPTKTYKNLQTSLNGKTPVVTNSELNNGISKYSDQEPTEKGGIITFSDTTTSKAIFYQKDDFIGYSHVQGLHSKEINFSRNALLYIVTCFRKAASGKFDYATKFTRQNAANLTIQLPVTPSGEIDFDYMEQYIEKIKKQHIEKIEKQYTEKIALMLKASGLDNYQLTEEDKAILKEKKEKKEFKIEDLFEVKTTKGLDEGKLTFSESRDYNFVGRTKKNNGIKGRILKQSFDANAKNTISVSQIGTITACYQPEEWYGSQNMFCLTSKNELTKNNYLYFVAVLNAYLRQYANSGRSVYPTLTSLKNAKITLPINPEGEIDFDYMEKYISAIIKTKIKNVVLEINKKLELYKQTQN